MGLLLFALFSVISPLGKGQVAPIIPSPTIQHDSLVLTVNPDRSVGVGWNTTSTLPIPQNISSLYPAGYAIHSSSSFSQQANAVIETSKVQYQIPAQLYIQPPLSNVNSISLTATQTGLSSQGSLTINTNPAVILPANNIVISYSTSLTQIQVNASAQFYFFPAFTGTSSIAFLTNRTAFQTKWTSTFGNTTWITNTVSQIQNATSRVLAVTTFGGMINSIDSASASVSLRLVAQPSFAASDFVTGFENLLSMGGTPIPTGLDTIIRSALNLVTGESATLTYTGSTHTVVMQFTTNFVSDLDAQVNKLKNQFFQLIFTLVPSGTVIPAQVLFLNSTSVTVSKISTTSDLDLSTGTSSMTLQGLLFNPPTVGTNTNFTIPRLLQSIGAVPAPGVNFTLAGGSNSTYSVKVIVPAGTPAPSSTTANSATWTNLHNATTLSAVRFVVQRLPSSFLDLLLSPAGIAIEAIAAAAIIGGVFLYMRKRRATPPTPVPMAGPTPAPGLGPGPAPPTP